jgi:hypothetical protein
MVSSVPGPDHLTSWEAPVLTHVREPGFDPLLLARIDAPEPIQALRHGDFDPTCLSR